MPGEGQTDAAARQAAGSVVKLPDLPIRHSGNNHAEFAIYFKAGLDEAMLSSVLRDDSTAAANQRVRGWLIRFCEPEVARLIASKDTPKAMWADLCGRFEGDDAARKVTNLLMRLLGDKPGPGDKAVEFMEAQQGLYLQLTQLKPEGYDEATAVMQSLLKLQAIPSCSFVVQYVSAMETPPDTYRKAVALVQRLASVKEPVALSTVVLGGRGRGRGGRHGGGGGRGAGAGGGAQGAPRKCFKCKQPGHLIANCPQWQQEQQAAGAAHATAAVTQVQAPAQQQSQAPGPAVTLAFATMANQQFLIDTAADNHFCTDRSIMSEYEALPVPIPVGTMGDSGPQAVGRGTVRLQTTAGVTLELRHALHVPKGSFNLLSVPKLIGTDNEVSLQCGADGARLLKRGMVIAQGQLKGGMFMLQG
jgi:hypothetical protein